MSAAGNIMAMSAEEWQRATGYGRFPPPRGINQRNSYRWRSIDNGDETEGEHQRLVRDVNQLLIQKLVRDANQLMTQERDEFQEHLMNTIRQIGRP